jgi:RNA polymerase sigma factor (sigma-70 family)
MNIPELVKEAQTGSVAAQKYLFETFADRMHILCRRYVKNKEDAEEILMDGFYKFFKNLSSFSYQGEIALQAWLKRIMINECLMFLRRKNAFNMVSETAALEVTLDEVALNNLSVSEIFNLIIQLPVGYRTVFNLHVMEGMGHKEIADLLGIHEGTSRSQLSKAKTLLQKKILQNKTDYGQRRTK